MRILGSIRDVDTGRVSKCKAVNDQLIHMIELAEEVGETVWIEVE